MHRERGFPRVALSKSSDEKAERDAVRDDNASMPAKPTVLILERDPDFVGRLKRWFIASCLDLEVLPCSSGADALDLMRQQRIDLILTAYLVPAIDGLQFISAVRAFDTRVPILMISNVPVRTMALARGATGFFSKGSVWAELENTVRKVFRDPSPVVA